MYLLDANVFIDAKNRYYGFDIVPAFWDWLRQAHAAGKVFTVQHVYDEIVASGDDLSTWIKAMPATFRLAPGPNDQASLTALSQWVVGSPSYNQAAVSTFLASADYFLVAQASSLGYAVVTHEVAGTGSKKSVKIPDACQAIGVPWMTPFKVLSVEQVSFQLA
jgi:Domain of unknown function (DUF4411)